jgi:tungstate transport system substrate-binding protein
MTRWPLLGFAPALAAVLFACATLSGFAGSALAERSGDKPVLVVPRSLAASGLLNHLLPLFEKRRRIKFDVVVQEARDAIKSAEDGKVDVLWLNDNMREMEAVRAKTAVDHQDVMFSDLVLVGPSSDPAGVKGMTSVIDAVRLIASAEATFVSRGDGSTIHHVEQSAWQEAGVSTSGSDAQSWYVIRYGNMRQTLQTAMEKNGYTMIDRVTWLDIKDHKQHVIVVEDDPRMVVQYGVMLTNPAKHKDVQAAAGRAFIAWLTSRAGQKAINDYKIGDAYPFTANADQRKQ